MGDRPRPPHLRLTSRRLPDARRLAAVLESLPEGIAVLDLDRRIVHHNFRFVEIWGLPLEAIRSADGEEIRERGYGLLEDSTPFREGLERLAVEPETIHTDRARLRDGRLVERQIRPRYGPEGLSGWIALYRDVTDEEEAREELLRSRERYRHLFESEVAGVYRVSRQGELLECNRAFAHLLGYAGSGELEGRDLGELVVDRSDRDRFERELREDGRARGVELAVRRRDGTVAWLLTNATVVLEAGTDEPVVVGSAIDISRRKALEAELERMAYHDPLTGLPNRRLLADRAVQARSLAERSGTMFAVAFVDLVDFKLVNDRLGHEAGDRLLVEAGRRLQGSLREADTAARLGGDEFAALLVDVDGMEGARKAAGRVAAAFEAPVSLEGHEREIPVRLGVAVYPTHGATLEELLAAADRAVRSAEPASEAVFASSGPESIASRELAAPRLRRALAEDELFLHYQPVYALSDRRVAGAEALVRWNHPERGVLPAAAFLPLAERSGLALELDRLVLRRVLGRELTWPGEGPPGWIGVRLSRASALDPGFADELRATADTRGGSLAGIVLELRLRDLQRDPVRGLRAVRRLRDTGARVALRGLGIDPATVAQLRHPSEETGAADLLIFRNRAGGTDPELLGEVVRHGHELGLVVVVAGVESEEELTWIGSSGADLALGYALGPPVPPGAFPADDA